MAKYQGMVVVTIDAYQYNKPDDELNFPDEVQMNLIYSEDGKLLMFKYMDDPIEIKVGDYLYFDKDDKLQVWDKEGFEDIFDIVVSQK